MLLIFCSLKQFAFLKVIHLLKSLDHLQNMLSERPSARNQNQLAERVCSAFNHHPERRIRCTSTSNHSERRIICTSTANHSERQIRCTSTSNHSERRIRCTSTSNHSERLIICTSTANHSERRIRCTSTSNHSERRIRRSNCRQELDMAKQIASVKHASRIGCDVGICVAKYLDVYAHTMQSLLGNPAYDSRLGS